MAPIIRVALVGLSSAAKTSWAADAHLPYLLSERGKQRFHIVALLNSSSSSAENARKHFGLPESVRAYGSPDDLANDPAVDLVVCSTRVDTHFDTVFPSVKAGKAVFVEWPLAQSLDKASELLEAKTNPISIVGLQGRLLPPIAVIQGLLRDGAVGQVLSSHSQYFGALGKRDAYTEGLAYFADRSVGGNPSNIAFGHSLDLIHHTIGEFESFFARMQIQRPQLDIIGKDGARVGTVNSDVPDLITLVGPLAMNQHRVAKGASFTVSYRNGPSFPGTPGFVWTINGERGEIRMTAPGPYLQSEWHGDQSVVELHDYASDTVRSIPWEWQDWQRALPVRARNVGAVYEGIAHWKERSGVSDADLTGHGLVTFSDAVRRHEEIAEMYRQWDASKVSE